MLLVAGLVWGALASLVTIVKGLVPLSQAMKRRWTKHRPPEVVPPPAVRRRPARVAQLGSARLDAGGFDPYPNATATPGSFAEKKLAQYRRQGL